ncbi:hypothetical protein EDD22DRAFT_844519 [Suillus occidentalis]|nr:hypothetical protein EDD22DRAFT_844519 [Suillus occidentalis]
MKAVKINLWGRGGQHDLGGQLFNLIFFRKSGSTILFRAFNNLKIESYINLSKCYEGCKDLGRVEILHWPYKTPKLRMWRVVGEMHSRDQAVTLCNHVWMELSVLHGSYSSPRKVQSSPTHRIRSKYSVGSHQKKARGKLSTPEYPGMTASTPVDGVKCPPWVVLLPWKGTVKFDCVSCQYGTPPPAGFCQVVQMISPEITYVTIKAAKIDLEAAYISKKLESEDGIEDNEEPETDKDVDIPQEIKISCWVASEEGKVMVDSSCLLLKFDIRGKLSTPEYPGMTASTPVDGVKCPPWVVLLPWKGTVKFDCVSCQYGTPPPAEFRQVVQMISPEITVQVKISCWVASEEGKYTPINVESHTQDQVKISYWVASEEGKKFDIRGKLSTPEYLGMTVSTPVDGVKCPPWVVLLPWKGTIKFDCVSCQYGMPPPAGFCQVVQIISSGITGEVRSWVPTVRKDFFESRWIGRMTTLHLA